MSLYIEKYNELQIYLDDNNIQIIENPTDEQKKSKLFFKFDYWDIDKDDEMIQYYYGDTNKTFNTQTLRIGLTTMETRLFPEYRDKIYQYLKDTLSDIMTAEDLDIIIKLIADIFGDLYMRAKLLPWQINIDRCSDENLKPLSSIIGYRWQTGLTADQQRESVKLFCLIRRWRGTKFGLMNLIRTFGQDAKSLYSTADLSGVEVIEYASGGADTTEPHMYPGDIKIRIPELSTILKNSIFDTKLAGTRLIFTYYIFMGIYHLKMYEDYYYIIKYWVNFLTQGVDYKIKDYGSKYIDTPVGNIKMDQITHRVIRGAPNVGVQILTYYKEPWENGWILNVPGLTNYRGFIELEPTIVADHVLYK